MKTWFRRVVLTALAALAGYAAGGVVGAVAHVLPQMRHYPFLVERTPLPHHVPEHAGGVSLRFAMVQDVLHERFARHGQAHYRERDRLVRAKLDALAADDPARFALADDLGAGLERLGRSAEAVEVLRDKLASQQKLGLAGRDLYTTYANLGTFLIHAAFPKALAGDAAARAQFREGVEFVRRSVEVNPAAHFGRERWQAAVAEYFLAALDDPSLLTTYDCLGNRLDLDIESMLSRGTNWASTGYGRSYDAAFSKGEAESEVPEFFRPGVALDDPAQWPKLSPIRRHIVKVGAEAGWETVPVPSHRTPVPFDEPVLGMIGMWRQGGGANPYFALALGETMLRVGQRFLAWTAYERAARLADRFWPSDPSRPQFLRDHCRKRQAEIESTLGAASADPTSWQWVSPPRPGDSAANLRARFDAELSFGEDYQRRYQQFEESKIAAGASIFDDHFFDDFRSGVSSHAIASPVGAEEWFAGVPESKLIAYTSARTQGWALFGAGLAAMTTALFLRWRAGSRRRLADPAESSLS